MRDRFVVRNKQKVKRSVNRVSKALNALIKVSNNVKKNWQKMNGNMRISRLGKLGVRN